MKLEWAYLDVIFTSVVPQYQSIFILMREKSSKDPNELILS
jgi:hypothetical protein